MIHSLFQPWRKATAQTLILSLSLILSLTLSACSDTLDQEENAYGTGELICFSISDGQTRAGVASTATPGKVLKLRAEGTNDSLYLNPTVSDFCASDLTGTNDALTRGTALSSSSLPASLQVLSMIQKQTGKASAQCFFDQTYTKNSSDVYSGTRNYFWPGSDWQLDFYVVNDPDVTIDRDNFTFTYEVPSSISDQKDLLATTAKSISGSYNSSVPLSFEHACTAIQFKVENIPSTASLKSITLKGVQYKGTYSFNATTSSPWTLESATTDFTLSNGTSSLPQAEDGTVYISNADNSYFMMLPQEFDEDSEAEVEVVLGFTGGKSDITYKASLAGTEWAQGKIVKYAIDIDADYQFDITIDEDSKTVDAHYIIAKISVDSSTAFLDGKGWEISANNDATLLYADSAKSYIQEGFWVDQEIDVNGVSTSARGSSTLSGYEKDLKGQTIYVMIPENTGSDSRDITLSVKINNKDFTKGNKTITQLATTDYGWEQIEENDEKFEFGFNWTRVVYYGYVYNYIIIVRETDTICQNIIDGYGAGEYASVESYKLYTGDLAYKLGISYATRHAIKIDYSAMSSLENNSSTEGLSNTIELQNKMGLSASTSFEEYISSMKKTEAGKTDENAFKESTGGYNQPPITTGTLSEGSAAMDECLKKNKYHIQLKSISQETDNKDTDNYEGSTLVLDELAWYLPAYGEFSSAPSDVTPSQYWSSTVVAGGTYSYDGSGAQQLRSKELHIRVKRK
jgi:hypothetical protein